MSCYIYLYIFLCNWAWWLVFLETSGLWLKCQISLCWFKQNLATQHAFQVKNTLQEVEEDKSWCCVALCLYLMWVLWDCWASDFPKTRNYDSHCFVLLQSPSWGMAAPLPPTACTPSCTSTPAPSRSPRSAGRTASSAAPWGPSWQCHVMAAVWVRFIHVFTHTKLIHKRKEVSSGRADGIREQTGNVSQSWDFCPPPYIRKHTLGWSDWVSFPWGGLSRAVFTRVTAGWGFQSDMTPFPRFLCELIHHSRSVATSLIIRAGRETILMSQSSSRFQAGGQDSPEGDEMIHRNNMLWVSRSTSLQAFWIFSKVKPDEFRKIWRDEIWSTVILKVFTKVQSSSFITLDLTSLDPVLYFLFTPSSCK